MNAPTPPTGALSTPCDRSESHPDLVEPDRAGEPVPATDMRYIYRHKARNLWNVSITRKGLRVGAKDFCDTTHGGCEAALAAAIAYRDQVLINAVAYTKSEFASKLKAHNTSKAPGVIRSKTTRKAPNGTIITQEHWIASYQGIKSKQKRTRSFSVFKFGEQGAYELAVAARAQLLEELALDEQAFLPKIPRGTPNPST